ncbi:MAG: helix-turn-helix domain-containing protein [Methanosarcinales archaeon]
MQKVLLISIESNVLNTIKNILSGIVQLETLDSELNKNNIISPDDDIQFFFIGFDINCDLQLSIKKFVFLSENREIPFVVIEPLCLRIKDRFSGLFFISFFEDRPLTSLQRKILERIRTSLDRLVFSGKLVHPTDPIFNIIEVQRKIVNDLCKKHTLSSLATEVNLHPSWLSLKFKEVSGVTFKNYLLRKKLCYSLWQIVSTRKPIKRIALEIGYKPLSFTKRFHALFGVAPSTIRKRLSFFLT